MHALHDIMRITTINMFISGFQRKKALKALPCCVQRKRHMRAAALRDFVNDETDREENHTGTKQNTDFIFWPLF